MAHGGYIGCQVVPRDRQGGEWFHGEVAQGGGGKELVTAFKRGRQGGGEGQGQGGGGRGRADGGGGGIRANTGIVFKEENNWQIAQQGTSVANCGTCAIYLLPSNSTWREFRLFLCCCSACSLAFRLHFPWEGDNGSIEIGGCCRRE